MNASSIFGFGLGFNAEERRFYEERRQAYITAGMPEKQATETAQEAVKKAIVDSKNEGVYGKGPLGEIMLRRLQQDQGGRNYRAALTAEGVSETDIREWWDISDIERRLIVDDQPVVCLSQALALIENGTPLDEAFETVAKQSFMFGDCTDTSKRTGEDRPLPWELKLRQLRWGLRTGPLNQRPDIWKDIEKFSSANAFLREQVRKRVL